MLDEYIKDKLYKSVCLIHLNTGETLICLVYSRDDASITVYFPYTVTNQGNLVEHCLYSYDRRFTISILGYIYAKAPSQDLCDAFFENVMTDHTDEFRRVIVKFAEALASVSPDSETPTNKTLH